jgi:hypothetical protein
MRGALAEMFPAELHLTEYILFNRRSVVVDMLVLAQGYRQPATGDWHLASADLIQPFPLPLKPSVFSPVLSLPEDYFLGF